MTSTFVARAAAAFVVVAVMQAPRPDLAGTWTLDPARSSAVGGGQGGGRGQGRSGGGGGLGLGPSAPQIAIAQNATVVVIDETWPAATLRKELKLDGTAAQYVVAMGENAGQPARATSSWKADRLISTVAVAGKDATRTYVEERYRDGEALIVEIRLAGSSNSRTTVYVRKRE